MDIKLNIPAVLLQLASMVSDHGGRAYLVGGGVRDYRMDQPVKDWDIEVFGIPEGPLHKLLQPLGNVNTVGRAFGVFKLSTSSFHGEIDISIPRKDNKVGPGHRGIMIEGDPNMDPKEAASRRDLTVNAIMVDLLDRSMLDPFGGCADIKNKRLRAVCPETFLEDPLRPLRVIQFAARLGFSPDPALLKLCEQSSFHELPAERIQGEWEKLMLRGRYFTLALDIARSTGILSKAFPEAANHDHSTLGPALERLSTSLSPTSFGDGRRWAAMLGLWLHRCTIPAGEATLDRLNLHRYKGYPLRQRVLALIPSFQSPIDTDSALRHLSTETDLAITLLARSALSEDKQILERLQRSRELGIENEAPQPILKGRHLQTLGMQPGPQMGAILQEVYLKQLDGDITDLSAAKAYAIAYLM